MKAGNLMPQEQQKHGLGWYPSEEDTRDWAPERMFALVDLGAAIPVAWETPVWLYQGQTPHCVGFTGAAFQASNGSRAGTTTGITDADGHAIYYECKIEDGQPLQENGSTGRSLAKVLMKRGVIDAYSLTSDFVAAKEWVEHYGPVAIGIWWYTAMFTKDAQGLIRPGGKKEGGHEILWRAEEQALDNILHNSWGQQWGECFIKDLDLSGLLADQGEALLMVKLGLNSTLPWPDLIGYEMLPEDLRGAQLVKEQGAMHGYDDIPSTFRPALKVTIHQVKTVLGNMKLPVPPPIEGIDEWVTPALRGWVRDNFPGLVWVEERWEETLTRFQLLMLVGRLIRGA